MKKIFLLSLILVALTATQSCTDLVEEPVGLLAPEAFFQSVADVETAVLGSYAYIASEQFYGRKLVLSLQLRSDMCDIGDRNTPGRRQQVNDFNMDSNNGMITAFWPRAYQIIGAANAAIAGAEQVGEPAGQINELIAESRFIRAFAYYHLVRVFGDIPYIDFAIDDPESVSAIGKTPESEVYTNIIADLEFAKTNLPDEQDGLRTRPTKGTAAAYLSSVHMTLSNWQDAYNEAKYVIDNSGTFGYRLMDDFATLWDATQHDGLAEHIFAVDFAGNLSGPNNQNTDWMAPITGIRSVTLPNVNAGWSVSVPAFSVYDTWDARDYRRRASMIDSAFVDGEWSGYELFAPNHGSPRPHIGKYFRNPGTHRGDGGRSDNNYVAFRYAEVLLIAAEALNELGGSEGELLGYLNEIRARARNWNGAMTDFPADVAAGLSQGEMRDLIMEERRLELAFEFKRWYDIKRRDMGVEVFNGPNSLEPHPTFDPTRDYYFPIPQDEIDRNENLLPQNPGY
ncbi:MAG: RagB/SusD family nutrient uptake outer membrane protein [Bacteroidota bacterium]